jgi:hypothetical protein
MEFQGAGGWDVMSVLEIDPETELQPSLWGCGRRPAEERRRHGADVVCPILYNRRESPLHRQGDAVCGYARRGRHDDDAVRVQPTPSRSGPQSFVQRQDG